MQQISLTAHERNELGRGPTGRMRKTGWLPAVIYGPSGLRHLSVAASDFRKLWNQAAGRTHLIDLQVEGSDSQWAIIKDYQRDPRTDHFMHVDFQEIERGKDMTVSVGVRVTGDAFGVKNEGGTIEIQSHELEVRCRPRNLPEMIVVDVSELKVGESLHVGNLTPPEGVVFLDDPDQVVIACVGQAPEEEEPEVEAAAEGEGEEGESAEEEGEAKKEEENS